MIALNDHISKEMNELNLIRCKHIPKRPGADWQDLPDEKVISTYNYLFCSLFLYTIYLSFFESTLTFFVIFSN
jgi:hypothetical protein